MESEGPGLTPTWPYLAKCFSHEDQAEATPSTMASRALPSSSMYICPRFVFISHLTTVCLGFPEAPGMESQ